MTRRYKDQKLSEEQLSAISGGEGSGFCHENEELIKSDDPSEGLLDEKKLSSISGGTTNEEIRAHRLEFDPEAKG